MKFSLLPISITTFSITSLTILVQSVGLLQTLEWTVYDRLFSLRPIEPIDDRLLIVTIDEADIENVGQWPLSDADLTRAIQTLQKYDPVAIGLDLYRNLPVEPGHVQWNKLLESTPNLIGIEKGIGTKVSPPKSLQNTDRIALTDLLVDADGKIRRALLSHPESNETLKLGLGAKLALMYLEKQGIILEEIDDLEKRYRLGKSTFVPFHGNDGGYVRTNSSGYQILLNYRGHLEAFRTVSLTQVLEKPLDPQWVRDRIVLIGSVAPSLNDFFYTPLSSRLANTPPAVPGIVIHANVASQLLGAALEGRTSIQTLPEPVEWLWIALWSSVGAIVPSKLLTRHDGSQRLAYRGRSILFCGSVGSSLLFLSSYGAFFLNVWIPAISPWVASITSATVMTIYHLKQLQQEREELKHQQLQLDRDRLRAEAASTAKSQFLANMSHELRTPLNAILGFTRIMSGDTDLKPSYQEYLDIIYRNGEHLLELIDDILDLSKIEAGRMSLNESNFDLYDLINHSVALFQNQAEQKELRLLVDIEPGVPQYIRGDRQKLRSCLVNLLGNAIKFTQQGSIRLEVSTRGRQEKTAAEKIQSAPQTPNPNEPIILYFVVRDTGMGIAPEELDRVFEAFVQTQSGRNSSTGTGLGLAITQQFVRLMGGDISVKSVVEEGTTIEFQVRITPWERERETIEIDRSVVIGLQPGQPSFRILVVDNDADSRLLLVAQLENIGFEVRSAENGLEAMVLWEDWQPQLIWMSMQMPIADGLTATRQIRERENQNQSEETLTIIIGMSASLGNFDRDAMLAAGCDEILSKPISEETALETIAQYLDVCYLYKSLLASRSLEEVESFIISQLREMPLSWVRSLHRAANEVNETLVLNSIEQIPEDRLELAQSLLSLTHNFRLDIIVRLTQSVLRDV